MFVLCSKKRNGFTLVEVLLAMTIAITLLLALSVFFRITIDTRAQHTAISEVETQGALVLEHITAHIRNARAITSPATSSSASSLTLLTATTTNPVVIDVSGGTVRISQGGGGAVPLTSSRVIISDLVFHNVSASSTRGAVWVQFSARHVNAYSQKIFDYEKIFFGGASIR